MVLLLGGITQLYAQTKRVIKGVIRDQETGEGLPGVTILIKGTSQGTATDANGAYELKVKIGDIVRISYVGMKAREVLITYENSLSLGLKWDIPNYNRRKVKYYNNSQLQWQADTTHLKSTQKGVATFTDSSATYRLKSNYNSNSFRVYGLKFKSKLKKGPHKGQFLVYDRPYSRAGRRRGRDGLRIKWQQEFALKRINRLPNLQKQYAQGSPVNGRAHWQGPETGEVFSWGPAISQLSFDHTTHYPYDKNGRLTTTSSGRPAKAYNPLNFFRTGTAYTNELEVTKHWRNQRLHFLTNNQWNRSVIPGNETRSNYLKATYKKGDYYTRLNWRVNLEYFRQRNALPEIGANYQNILRNVLTTPPTFDNAYGQSRKEALNNPATYTLTNGTKRSFSSIFADNPFGVVTQIPDNNTLQHWSINAQLKHGRYRALHFKHQIVFQKDVQAYETGVLESQVSSASGRFVARKQRQSMFFANSEAYKLGENLYLGDLKVWTRFSVRQGFRYEQQNVDRLEATDFKSPHTTALSFANNIQEKHIHRRRFSYHLMPRVRFGHWNQKLSIILSSPIYLSSTLHPKHQQYFLPQLSARLSLAKLFRLPYRYLFIEGAFSKSLRETVLLHNRWDYNTTQSSVQGFQQYYENTELPFQSGIAPEISYNYELKTFFQPIWNLKVAVVLKSEKTKNLLVPEFTNNQFGWSNVGERLNNGINVQVAHHWKSRHMAGKNSVNWASFAPRITKLYDSRENVAIAGYQETSQQLIAGKPYGVLYGTRFLRNDQGQLMIDENGFPIVDTQLGVLGNPNPRWVLSGEHSVEWKRVKFLIKLKYQHGGQRWNGTQAVLDYLGTSAHTATQRNIRNYIFQGVNQAGATNQIAVDFANPASGISQNRWVRYGLAGVAEEYIEDASNLRIETMQLTYDFGLLLSNKPITFNASVFVNNLLLYAPYRGVDPATSLLGYTMANGLDLFNSPANTSYGLKLQMMF